VGWRLPDQRTRTGPKQQQLPHPKSSRTRSLRRRSPRSIASSSSSAPAPVCAVAAHADPQRALAWLELAASEATRNPAGFVLAGLRSGEWPAQRGPASSAAPRLQSWIDRTAWRLGREAAHEILDDWDLDLDDGERAQWHQAIDEVCERHAADEHREAVA
jgi:hypothetical protein